MYAVIGFLHSDIEKKIKIRFILKIYKKLISATKFIEKNRDSKKFYFEVEEI